jgi:exopolyphosphatase/guanosine-5'-triphosphate,3'-diphosphate pyrophosphatase
MSRERLAAIDIGTNSIRCIVVECREDGGFTTLDDEKETVRLGEGIAETGQISTAAVIRAETALVRMRKLAEGLKVKAIDAVATSAVRKATNGPLLVKRLSDILGTPIRVISGEEEAALAAKSALRNFDTSGKRFGIIDVGGGSVELITAQGNHVEEYFSFELGAVVMTEQFFKADPVRTTDLRRFAKHIRETIKKQLDGDKLFLPTLIGSGGTINAIGQMALQLRQNPVAGAHGPEVLRSEVVHILAMLLRRDLKGRREVPGLSPDRADIIVAGVVLVDTLMELFDANTLLVNAHGIREGMILEAIKRRGMGPEAPAPKNWRESVLAFGRSCQTDEIHSGQVAALSLALFDQLAEPFGLKKRERVVLETAALLHDVGYYISYHSHHKHSCHLIRHAELYGITPREREMAAVVARYHRKSLPKKKHDEFQRLNVKEQLTAARLAGILRLADGLDRRRCSAVTSLTCTVEGNLANLTLTGTEDLAVELFGGSAKKDLFEKAFNLQVVLTTAAQQQQPVSKE